MPLSPEARLAFQSVINMRGKRDINSVIDKLRGAVGVGLPYFQDAAKSLPVLHAEFTDPNNGEIGRAVVKRIGGGSFGTIWQSAGATAVYKRTMNRTKGRAAAVVEDVYRENYVEAFIQSVLQSDPNSGSEIGKLEAIYRDATVRRRGTRRAAGARTSSNRPRYDVRRASSEPLNTTFFYKMEYIRYTFKDAMKIKYRDAGGPIPLDDIHAIFSILGATLAELYETYGFRHCDLHVGNLMFTDTMELKIIDFGKSCLNIDGVVYSKNRPTCESYDLLIFLVAVREYFFHYFDAEVQGVINYFFTDADGTNIYDEVLRLHTDRPTQGALFHYFYNEYSIDLRGDPVKGYPWGEDVGGGHTLYSKFVAGLVPRKVEPEHFMDVWEHPRAARPALAALAPAAIPLPPSSNSGRSRRSTSSTHLGRSTSSAPSRRTSSP